MADSFKLGYWSPMPPAATGVADYSASLVPHLGVLGKVAVNAPGDVNVYHLGNNQLHREIYHRALEAPGVAVVHDALLQHFFLGTLDQNQYIEEFVFNYGEWSRGLAEELWRDRARSGAAARYFEYPMLRRVVERQHAVIVHNPAAAEIVTAHGARRVLEIPHLFVAPQAVDGVDAARLRHRLHVAPSTLLAGMFGHQRETKRLAVVARAFKLAQQRGANARLLVAGDFVSSMYRDAVEPLLEGALRAPHLGDQEFWTHLAVTDLCVNLRYPSAAETSGVAIRMMGLGKPVAFTRDAATSRYPENACLRVDVGPAEEEMLAGYIELLAANRDVGTAIGRNAAAYIAREHAPEKVAAMYWEAARESRMTTR